MVNLIVDLLREAGEHLKRIKVTYALSGAPLPRTPFYR